MGTIDLDDLGWQRFAAELQKLTDHMARLRDQLAVALGERNEARRQLAELNRVLTRQADSSPESVEVGGPWSEG